MDIYHQAPGSEQPPSILGLCFLHPDRFRQSQGQLDIVVTSPQLQPLGSLEVDYLVIRPLPTYTSLDFSLSYRSELIHHTG